MSATTALGAHALRPAFWKALFVCLVLVAQLGAVVHLLNRGHDRPEGAAERWLAAVGDTGRNGVRDDARKRAERIGPVELAAPLIAAADRDGRHNLFSDLEVGKAVPVGDAGVVRVPFRVHPRDGDPRRGTIVLQRESGEWRVVRVEGVVAGLAVPSDGGPAPSSAGWALWLVALTLGAALTAGCALLVVWAGQAARQGAPGHLSYQHQASS